MLTPLKVSINTKFSKNLNESNTILGEFLNSFHPSHRCLYIVYDISCLISAICNCQKIIYFILWSIFLLAIFGDISFITYLIKLTYIFGKAISSLQWCITKYSVLYKPGFSGHPIQHFLVFLNVKLQKRKTTWTLNKAQVQLASTISLSCDSSTGMNFSQSTTYTHTLCHNS